MLLNVAGDGLQGGSRVRGGVRLRLEKCGGSIQSRRRYRRKDCSGREILDAELRRVGRR